MDPSLYRAAASGDICFLDEVVSTNRTADVLLQKTAKGNNALHVAAQFMHTNFFKHFPQHLDQSVLFWATNVKDDCPLHIAARVGCAELVEFLINHARKLRTDPTDVEAGTVGTEGYKELLRMNNSDGDTALHVAVKCGHQNVVVILMDVDPELSSFTNNANESPLFLAISKGFPKIGSSILDKSSKSISFEGVKGVTALHAAVTRTSTCKDIVKKMVSENREIVKEVDELGWTPLHYAAFKGNVEAIKLLMGPDSSVAYILDKSGMSALHIAAHRGQIKAMKELLKQRPDTCELLNHKGQNVLHAAVLGESRLAVKYILKTPELAGTVNEADNDGNTPFHLAASTRNLFILGIMTKYRKVDKGATNNHHAKAVDIFVGDKLEVLSLGLNRLLNHFGRPIGVPMFQQYARHHVQLSEHSDEAVSSATTTTTANYQSIRTKFLDDSKKFDTNLLVAMLIATVTFSAAVNMPGGFNVNGVANKHRNIFFYVFVLFDSISFILSVFAVFNYFMVLTVTRLTLIAPQTPAVCIRYSIAAMTLAFASGVFVVLPKYSPLGILVLLICSALCCLIIRKISFTPPPPANHTPDPGTVVVSFSCDLTEKLRQLNLEDSISSTLFQRVG